MSSSGSALLVLALAGCNQIFGSVAVGAAPAAQFDAPLDAPFSCPAIGQTPQFSPYVHQFLARDCGFYGTAGTEAMAECQVGTTSVVEVGPINGELVPAAGIPAQMLPATPRISPDGQTILARLTPSVVEYARSGNTWSVATPEVFAQGSSGVPFSSIAQTGSTLRVLMLDFQSGTFVEYERANGTWSVVATTPISQLIPNAQFVNGLSLSSDGLRLVIATGTETRFTDRPSLDAAFRPSDALQAPGAMDIYATDDCARIYLSGLGSVFYAQRL